MLYNPVLLLFLFVSHFIFYSVDNDDVNDDDVGCKYFSNKCSILGRCFECSYCKFRNMTFIIFFILFFINTLTKKNRLAFQHPVEYPIENPFISQTKLYNYNFIIPCREMCPSASKNYNWFKCKFFFGLNFGRCILLTFTVLLIFLFNFEKDSCW